MNAWGAPVLPHAPPAMVDSSLNASLMALGISAKGRERLKNFRRLSHLVGDKQGFADADECVSTNLERLVLTGRDAADIVEARKNVATLKWCARLMYEDVKHLMDHPEDAGADFDFTKAEKLRADLLKLVQEFEARAGEPNEASCERAEKMRCKIEQRLLPKLRQDVPRWAERLRFHLQDVIAYLEATPMLQEEEEPGPPPALPAPKEETESESEYDDDNNPPLTADELRVLRQMGWVAPGQTASAPGGGGGSPGCGTSKSSRRRRKKAAAKKEAAAAASSSSAARDEDEDEA